MSSGEGSYFWHCPNPTLARLGGLFQGNRGNPRGVKRRRQSQASCCRRRWAADRCGCTATSNAKGKILVRNCTSCIYFTEDKQNIDPSLEVYHLLHDEKAPPRPRLPPLFLEVQVHRTHSHNRNVYSTAACSKSSRRHSLLCSYSNAPCPE